VSENCKEFVNLSECLIRQMARRLIRQTSARKNSGNSFKKWPGSIPCGGFSSGGLQWRENGCNKLEIGDTASHQNGVKQGVELVESAHL
jgi:hypothetical protein